jgi:hypothetical protein
MAPARKSDPMIGWVTITYRSVIMAVVGLLLLAGVVFYIAFPDATKRLWQRVENAMAGKGVTDSRPKEGQQAANFTQLDGTVRVKKHNSNNWVSADFNLPLEKGDVVQTASDGIAKIVFADGSNYVVKQDSLIVIEENSTDASQRTQVSVQVTTGTVDLSTSTYTQGSRSGVSVAGASATFAPESSAQVRNDPRDDKHEIMVKKGAGEVTRNGETVALASYERVSFSADSAQMSKSKEISPPVLIAPQNMAPIFISGGAKTQDFTWTPVSQAKLYRVRISKNPYFSSTVYDQKIGVTQARVANLKEGNYYWQVQSVDATGRESVESERNRFTIIPKSDQPVSIQLELQPFVQHGHILEIKGQTEREARVMVNGNEAEVRDDGSFFFFTKPLPPGENLITVTAQNTRGGTRTRQEKVVIQQ